MTTYYIVKYFSNPTSRPRIVAFTHDIEKARELCSQPETRETGKWLYGFTEHPPVRPAKAGYPTACDLLKAIYSNARPRAY